MDYKVIYNDDSVELGYSPDSGVKIIYVDGLPFKDFIGDKYVESYGDEGDRAVCGCCDCSI